MTFVWYSNDVFHYMFKAEFVTLVSLKVLSGSAKVISDMAVFVLIFQKARTRTKRTRRNERRGEGAQLHMEVGMEVGKRKKK